LAKITNNRKRQIHALVRVYVTQGLLPQEFSWENKIIGLESQGASRQDELVGDKLPVVK
jgi:hypothetical protein